MTAAIPLETVLKTLFPDAVMLPELDPSCELARHGKSAETLYTNLVAGLKTHRSAMIAKLANLIWNVIGSKNVSLAVWEPVPTMTVSVLRERESGILHAQVLLPLAWAQMVRNDPIMQLGGLIATGSQAVDFYNGRFTIEPSKVIRDRGISYEAEMLRCLEGALPLNDYQTEVLRRFPHGWEARFAYPYRDVAMSTA